MATVNPNVPPGTYVAVQPQAPVREPVETARPQLRVFHHSNLFYWWPVWAVGFLCAILTYVHGAQFQVGDAREYYHPSSTLGIVFFLTLFLVILITNVTVRGLASGMVILSLVFTVVLFAYLDWWDDILAWMGNLSVHLNLGAYLARGGWLFDALAKIGDDEQKERLLPDPARAESAPHAAGLALPRYESEAAAGINSRCCAMQSRNRPLPGSISPHNFRTSSRQSSAVSMRVP